MPAFTGVIGTIEALQANAFEVHIAGDAEQNIADVALLVLRNEDAVHAALEQPSEIGLAQQERQRPEVLAVASKHVEGIELRPLVMLARRQGVEVRNAVPVEHDHLAVEREMFLAQLQRSAAAWKSARAGQAASPTKAGRIPDRDSGGTYRPRQIVEGSLFHDDTDLRFDPRLPVRPQRFAFRHGFPVSALK
jgi:hypothetical protein